MSWRKLKNDPVFRTLAAKYSRLWPPLIGLIATCYGIIDAFHNLGHGNPIASVLPGILKVLLVTNLLMITQVSVLLLHYWLSKKR